MLKHIFVSVIIAFHASLSNVWDTTDGQTVVFDKIETNIGGAYNGTTGVFTAPISGSYVFSLTYHMFYDKSHVSIGQLRIMQNNEVKIRVYRGLTNELNGATASGTTALFLNKGDHVYVQAGDTHMSIGSNKFSYFTGFLLW